MQPDQQDKIFDPFYTTKELGKGTGLGLPIVYGIITAHDGAIAVASSPEKGSTFTLYLPCMQRQEAQQPEQAEQDQPLPRGNQETILIAEDAARIRDMASQVLTEFGYRVLTAVDGDDAIRLFKEHQDQIRLLLFDLVMPNKGGYEAYQQIRGLNPTVSVIFTTGYAPQVAEGKLSQTQMQQLLHKPFAIVQLLKRVRTALDTEEK
jgi:CheY-like chemotaxis protein